MTVNQNSCRCGSIHNRSARARAAAKRLDEQLSKPFGHDECIIEIAAVLMDIDSSLNMMGRRLRDWANQFIQLPIDDAIQLAHLLIDHDQQSLAQQYNIQRQWGSPMQEQDYSAIRKLAHHTIDIARLRESYDQQIIAIMRTHLPFVYAIAGGAIGAKLLMHCGSLRKLAFLPGSSIQMLGAEDALFRHLRTKSSPPKHGMIIAHTYIAQAPKDKRGSYARRLANTISMAARCDYFGADPSYITKLKARLGT